MEFEINWWSVFGYSALIFFCIVPLILAVMALFFGAKASRRFLDALVMPDPEKLTDRYLRLRERNRRLSDDQLVGKIINQEAFKCGVIGFVTGFGGLPFMPLTVPLDAVASMRIQATMVQFVSRAYGHEERRKDVERVKTYLILAGSRQLTSVTAQVIREILLRVFLRSTLKVVPVLGGLIGAIANFLSAQAIGRTAVSWYRGDLRRLGLKDMADDVADRLVQSGAMTRAAQRLDEEDRQYLEEVNDERRDRPRLGS